MYNIPQELISKIFSYLPIISHNKRIVNDEIIKYHYYKKWCVYYGNIPEYSSDIDHDDYYINWLENDLLYVLNNHIPIMVGIGDELKNLMLRAQGDSTNKNDCTASGFVKKTIQLLTVQEVVKLDSELELYNHLINTGHPNANKII